MSLYKSPLQQLIEQYTKTEKHKVFLSYYHKADEYYKKKFEELFGHLYLSYTVEPNEFDSDNDDDKRKKTKSNVKSKPNKKTETAPMIIVPIIPRSEVVSIFVCLYCGTQIKQDAFGYVPVQRLSASGAFVLVRNGPWAPAFLADPDSGSKQTEACRVAAISLTNNRSAAGVVAITVRRFANWAFISP